MDEPKPPYVHAPAVRDHYLLAIFSLIAGLISLVAWLLPLCGLPVALTGMALGIVGRLSSRRSIAIAGIVTSAVGLLLAIANAAFGAYLGATGQLF